MLLVVVGLVDLALDVYAQPLLLLVWSGSLEAFEAMHGQDGPSVHDRLHLANLTTTWLVLATSPAFVVAWVRAGGAERHLRPWAWLAAIATVVALAPWVENVADTIRPAVATEPPMMLGGWTLGGSACAVAVGAALGWVHAFTKGAPGRRIAIGLTAAGMLTALPVLVNVFVFAGGVAPSWWTTPWGPLLPGTWLRAAGTLALAAGLWRAASPAAADEGASARLAAAGLRLARIVVFSRVAAAVLGVVLAIYAALEARSVDPMSASRRDRSFIVELVPWLGYLEGVLAMALVVAIGTACLQRRSRLAAALVGVSVLLGLVASSGSLAFATLVHEVIAGTEHHGFGWALHDLQDLDPILRWIGLASIVIALAGLCVLADALKRPAAITRALRFMALAIAFVLAWLHGRDFMTSIDSVGILLVPVMLFALVWMLLDLTTAFAEVAEGLEAEPAAHADSR